MIKNTGIIDRVFRGIIGIVFIDYAIPIGFPQTGWNWTGLMGAVPLLTAIVGYCPAYSFFGISTFNRYLFK
jgi:hypothetical protein